MKTAILYASCVLIVVPLFFSGAQSVSAAGINSFTASPNPINFGASSTVTPICYTTSSTGTNRYIYRIWIYNSGGSTLYVSVPTWNNSNYYYAINWNTPALYETTNYLVRCEERYWDNQGNLQTIWSGYGSLSVGVNPQYCPNGLDYTTYSPYGCTCPNNYVQSGSSCVQPAIPAAPSIYASPNSIAYNTPTALYVTVPYSQAGWGACYIYGGPIYGNGTSFAPASGTWGSGPLTSNTNFHVACNDNYYGWYVSPDTTVYVSNPAPVISFSASPATVNYGVGSTLTWSSTDASSCTLYNPAGSQVATGLSGSYITPGLTSASNTYSVTCSGAGGSTSASAAVTVNPPVLSLLACNAAGECSSPWVNSGHSAYLTYSATSVGSCTVSASPGGTLFTNTSGSAAATPALSSNTTYTLSCTGAPTPTSLSRTVTVAAACAAQSGTPISGWAWSEHAGWLSLDCTSAYQALSWPANYDTQNWGLTLNADQTLTGYAWSDKMGWVKFGGLSSFPTGSGTTAQNAQVTGSGASAALVGWARACAGTATGDCSSMSSAPGWDGWIALSGTTPGAGSYAVSFTSNPSYLPEVSGAWSSTPGQGFGWLAFNLSGLTTPSCTLSAAPFAVGSSTMLSYSSSNATSATFDQGLGSITPNTSGTIATPVILEPTLYTLSLVGPGGSGGCNVLAAPASGGSAFGCISLNSATCSPPQHQVRVQPGAAVSLYWNVQDATECAITGDNGQSWSALPTQGTQTTAGIAARTTFTLTCDGQFIDRGAAVLVPRFEER